MSKQTILKKEEKGFEWHDVANPSKEDLQQLAETFNLDESTVNNCLEHGQLPKIDIYEDHQFIILRAVAKDFSENSDILHETTDVLFVFHNKDFLITIHRGKSAIVDEVSDFIKSKKTNVTTKYVLHCLVSHCLKSFEQKVINSFSIKLDQYEENVFLHRRKHPFLRKLYYLKRQIDLYRIVLTLYEDIVNHFKAPEKTYRHLQNIKDQYSRTNTLYQNIAENTTQLFSIYFNIESNHTNEIMRTLTIISVFFMPLTFIVGVYGMNFENMPELDWKYGYPAVLLLMIFLSIIIYFWFKKKRWL